MFLREGEVLAGVSPPLADQLRGRSLMSPSEYPGELRRLGEDRVGGQHEAREVQRNGRITEHRPRDSVSTRTHTRSAGRSA